MCILSPLLTQRIRSRVMLMSISQLWTSSSLFSDVFGASITSPYMNCSYNNNNNKKRLNKIFQVFSDTLDIPIEPDPILIIFEVSEEFLRLTRVQQQLISAKKRILLFWKKKEVPTLKLRLTELTATLHLERIRYTLIDKILLFEKIWSPFICFLQTCD